MKSEEILKLFEDVKSRYDYWLTPSASMALWAEFGRRIYELASQEKENK